MREKGNEQVCVTEAGNGQDSSTDTHNNIIPPPSPPRFDDIDGPAFSFRAYRSRGGDDGGEEGGRCLEGMGSDDE